MNDRIRIILADDHPIVLKGHGDLIKEERDMELVETTDNGQKLVALVDKYRPDVVVTDLDMPVMSGVEATRIICKRFPDTSVVCLSLHSEPYKIRGMLVAGARGYVNKSADIKVLMEAIRAVHRKQRYHCRITSEVISSMIVNKIYDPNDPDVGVFTETELWMIRLYCQQLDLPEIAKKLGIVYGTAKRYRVVIFEKAGVDSVGKLVSYAREKGIYGGQGELQKEKNIAGLGGETINT